MTFNDLTLRRVEEGVRNEVWDLILMLSQLAQGFRYMTLRSGVLTEYLRAILEYPAIYSHVPERFIARDT